jgi:hypothetical protein
MGETNAESMKAEVVIDDNVKTNFMDMVANVDEGIDDAEDKITFHEGTCWIYIIIKLDDQESEKNIIENMYQTDVQTSRFQFILCMMKAMIKLL